ncbi:hypothetical protein SEA_ATUIN_56 [Arthrobacter phage Atuin]|nr:hypothetical protein SEA_ATUIN_155 [Arthrobacter phage Atuin]
MLLALFIAFGVGALVFLAYVCELDEVVKEIWQRRKSIKNPKNSKWLKDLQPHVRRIQQIEKDGRQALEAIQNLHETKKKLNADFKADWDNQYRLLLPPPEAPKGRAAVRFKPYHQRQPFIKAYGAPYHNLLFGKGGVDVDTRLELVPVGAIDRDGYMWYAFNNIPGHAHEILFIQCRFFADHGAKFWAFLPEVKFVNGKWEWETSKLKTLAATIKDIKSIEIRV